MKLNVRKLVLKSLLYYRKAAFNQAAIIMILTAVVTGSLLTGYSVRESLRISAGKRLGNTGLVISSGMRYFSSNVDSKLSAANGTSVASVLETEGTVEKFGNDGQQESVKIYGVKHTFFQLFLGYYKMPQETGKTLRDGWLYSGDTGFIDGDGHLVVFDRSKDVMTLRDGSKFAPQYLETRLKFSPYIKDVWVIGDHKPYVTGVICIDYGVVGKWAEDRNIHYTS
ncbi:MAG: hypothetical protein ACUVTX_11345, partial [Bacteroidales bacterium]